MKMVSPEKLQQDAFSSSGLEQGCLVGNGRLPRQCFQQSQTPGKFLCRW